MKWFKRGLWLFAWGVWLWLGVGLHHHLPRDLGPAVCKLPVNAKTDRLMAFVGDGDIMAVGKGRQVTLYNAATGKEIGSRSMPILRDLLRLGGRNRPEQLFLDQVRRGVLFGNQQDPQAPTGGFGVLDIMSGEWRKLSSQPARCVVLHPLKPWVAILEGENQWRILRAAVVDWQTGAELFTYRMPVGETFSCEPLFLAGRDQIVLPMTTPMLEKVEWDNWLEVWSVAPDPSLEQVIDGVYGWNMSPFAVSLNGRLLCDGTTHGAKSGDKLWMDVYDFRARRFLSTKPRNAPSTRVWFNSRVPPTLAPSGRAVLRYESDAWTGIAKSTYWMVLVEVGTGNLLWESSRAETVEKATPKAFLVLEAWHKLWDRWLPNLKRETRAWRSLDDGRVLVRTTKGSAFELENCNAAQTLFITSDGTVRHLPLQVNWKLLLLCQSILALPLILLWAILLWRRRRKAVRSVAA